jgi:biotin carboxylase
MGDRFLRIDLCDLRKAASDIADHPKRPDAVVGVDEQGIEVAAMAAEQLGLAHNPPGAVAITRNKRRARQVLSAAGLAQPKVYDDPVYDDAPAFPCVVKATTLSGSRGVIRANDTGELETALERVRAIAGAGSDVLVEAYVPGAEVAVEGLLDAGTLYVLAIFDKPDPLEGPYFEETIYVTPSRLPTDVQHAVERVVADACAAIGLSEGPVHAELRLPPAGPPVLLEVAARSIGGLCARTLSFGAGISLEEVILRHAVGLPLGSLERARAASGVMMLPIASAGILRAVDGLDAARAVDGIDGVEITIPIGQPVAALPEGDRYLGFCFASGDDPAAVEASLRAAYACLAVTISPD